MRGLAAAHPWALIIVILAVAWLLCRACRWIAREWKDMDEDLEEYRYYLKKQDEENKN